MFNPKLSLLTRFAALAAIGFSAVVAKAADGPTDPQIVVIVIVADNLDIAYGKIALKKSHSAMVREFARRMVTDHSAVQKSVIALAKKLGVTKESSPTSEGLESGGKAITAKLKSLHGKAFDKFYIDNEVSYHKLVTDAVAQVLIPNA
jgi:putative membrane protein